MVGEERKNKMREVRNEPKGCDYWWADGSISDHQPLGFLPPPADNFTNTLPPTTLRYNVNVSSTSDLILHRVCKITSLSVRILQEFTL